MTDRIRQPFGSTTKDMLAGIEDKLDRLAALLEPLAHPPMVMYYPESERINQITLGVSNIKDWALELAVVLGDYQHALFQGGIQPALAESLTQNLSGAIIDNVLGRSSSSSPNNPLGYRWVTKDNPGGET